MSQPEVSGPRQWLIAASLAAGVLIAASLAAGVLLGFLLPGRVGDPALTDHSDA
jgi:hypothetical protein